MKDYRFFRFATALVPLLWSLSLVANEVPGNWAMFGNNASHTGHQPGIMGDQAPFFVWRRQMPSGEHPLNSVVVANGRVFVTPNNEGVNSISFVMALDADSGDEVWTQKFEEPYTFDPPGFSDGNVYVQRRNAHSGFLESFDADSGRLNWSTETAAAWLHSYGPTIADGKVWINSGPTDGVYGFNQNTGELLFFSTVIGAHSDSTPLYHQGRLYAWTAGRFVERHPTSGVPIFAGAIEGYPFGTDGAVAIAQNGMAFFQGSDELFAVDLLGHFGVWRASVQQLGTPAIVGNDLYATEDWTVKRFDAETGEMNGSFAAPGKLLALSQPILTDDKLIVSSLVANETYIIDRFTMELVHTIEDGGLLSLAENKLFIVNDKTISTWHVAYRARGDDQAPAFYLLPEVVTAPMGTADILFDIGSLVFDPDDDTDAIYLTVESNSVSALLSAKIVNRQLMLSFADLPGETVLTLKANSNGQTVTHSIRMRLRDPDIAIELFDGEGNAILPGGTASGIIHGKATVINRMMHRAELFQNFRVLPTNEQGDTIDTQHWERTFTIDTSLFFDGENLISIQVHPHREMGQEYSAEFDVDFVKVITANNNPAPNGDQRLPELRIRPDRIFVEPATHVPGHVLQIINNSLAIEDDSGVLSIDYTKNSSEKAQLLPQLGTSILGRFRRPDEDPPYASSMNGMFEGIHLLNFQRPQSTEATLAFFFNDGSGRANYSFLPLTLPPLSTEDRNAYPLPALDARILNVSHGDEIIIPDDGNFMLQVEVTNPASLGQKFPKMSTWVGNRSVAITDLAPYLAAMGEGETSFVVNVAIPVSEIRLLQNARQGSPDNAAFSLWVDFTSGDRLNLPASERVQVSMIRTKDHDWPFGPPRVEFLSPLHGDQRTDSIDFELYAYGNMSQVEALYVQVNGGEWIRITDFQGVGGRFRQELMGYPRQQYTLNAFFTDAAGVVLGEPISTDEVTFELKNQAPVAVFDAYVLNQGGSVSVASSTGLLANDLDLESDSFFVSSVGSPEHGDLTWHADGSLTYAPDAGFFGVEQVYYTVRDDFDESRPGVILFSVRPEDARVPGDWSMFGNGPAHTGYQAGYVTMDSPAQIWSKDISSTGGGVNQVVVAGNQVFLTPRSFHLDTYMLSLDASSGEEIWRHDFDAADADAVNAPAFSDGSIYVQKGDYDRSQLWSFNARTGQANWSSPHRRHRDEQYAPTVAAEKVFVNGGGFGGILGFNQMNGEQLFSNSNLGNFDQWTPLFYEGRLFSWTGGVFREFDPESGNILRSLKLGEPSVGSEQHAMAIADSGVAFLQNDRELTAVDLTDFRVDWQVSIFQKGTPAVADGMLYVIEGDKVLLFDAASGILVNSATLPSQLVRFSQPIVTDDVVIVASNGNTFVLDRFSLSLLHTIDAGGLLSLADDTLFVAGNGSLSAWRVSQHELESSARPIVENPIADMNLEQGSGDMVIDLRDVFSDPDSDLDEMQFLIVTNTSNSLVSANIDGDRLMLSFASFPGHSDIVVRANSSGRTAQAEFRVTLRNPEVFIELFDATGALIEPGDTISGLVEGKATIRNHVGQHVQFYQNFRILDIHEPSHAIDSDNWEKTFTVDTSTFYDGDNLLSIHVHPHRHEGQPYLSSFDVGTLTIKTGNGNPAPNGDTALPSLTIDPSKITLQPADLNRGYKLETAAKAVVISDDFGSIDIDQKGLESGQAQMIAHLGTSVLGRFRWDGAVPFGDSSEGDIEGVHLLNFQQETETDALLVFFVNDGVGRANYGFHQFQIPPLTAETMAKYSPPDLDAKILNVKPGDEIIVPDGEHFKLLVEVSSVGSLTSSFPRMTTWVGNRVVAITELAPYFSTPTSEIRRVIVEVEIPADEIQKLQNSRFGGQDSAAFAIWNDFNSGRLQNLPSSDHVHVSMIRTRGLDWPFGEPAIEIISPVPGDTPKGGVELTLYVSGDLSKAPALYVQVNDGAPIRFESYQGLQGFIQQEFQDLPREALTLTAFFTDESGTALTSEGASASVDVELINQPPVVVLSNFVLDEDEVLTLPAQSGFLSNDLDLENDPLTVLSVDRMPVNGELLWSSDGSFTYTPNAGFVGTDTLYYTVDDGWERSEPGMAVFTVRPSVDTGVPGEWHMFGNDASHSGFQSGFIGDQAPMFSWRKPFETINNRGINPVAVADHQVFVVPKTNNSNGVLVALNAETGDENWRRDFAQARTLNPPAYADGNVYLQWATNSSNDSKLWSFGASAGTVNWSSSFDTQGQPFYAPTIADGRIWISGGMYGGMYGHDQNTGARLFFYPHGNPIGKWAPLYHQGRMYSWVNPSLSEHDTVSGEVSRTVGLDDSGFTKSDDATAIADNGIAYLQATAYLTAVDLDSFEVLWRRDIFQKGIPAASGGSVYVIEGDTLSMLDGLNGTLLADFIAEENLILYSQPLLTNDAVFISSADRVYVLDRFTLELLYTIEEGGLLSLADNVLYIAGASEVSAWTVARRDTSLDAQNQDIAIFDSSAGELSIPIVRINGLDHFGVESSTYATDVRLQLAAGCEDLTFELISGIPADASSRYFLQGNSSSSVSNFNIFNGELKIPKIGLAEQQSEGGSIVSFEWVKLKPAVNCSDLSFTVTAANPAE